MIVFVVVRIWSIINRSGKLSLSAGLLCHFLQCTLCHTAVAIAQMRLRLEPTPVTAPSVSKAGGIWFTIYLLHSAGSSSQGFCLSLVFMISESCGCLYREAWAQYRRRRAERRQPASDGINTTFIDSRADGGANSSEWIASLRQARHRSEASLVRGAPSLQEVEASSLISASGAARPNLASLSFTRSQA